MATPKLGDTLQKNPEHILEFCAVSTGLVREGREGPKGELGLNWQKAGHFTFWHDLILSSCQGVF